MAPNLPSGDRARPAGEPDERLTEQDVSRLWYEGGFARNGMRTRCGRRVRVLYRGLPNGDRGPDYRGAVLSVGRSRPRAGDIELHVRASQWRTHGHQRDPEYNGVILHVVWQDDDPSPTVLHSGRQVPVLALSDVITPNGPARLIIDPCHGAGHDLRRLGMVLDRAGQERFLGKASRMEGDMAAFPAQEVLYQSLAESMGYSQNKTPFRRLAAALPLGVVEGFLLGKPLDQKQALAQALLLGTAGLLPSQRHRPAGDEWPALLEETWSSHGLEPQLRAADWRHGVRPENHPVRRLAALANLLAATLEEGLLSWALAAVADPGALFRETVERESYWHRHFDFGLTGHRLGPALIGPDRALVIASNVILPFAYAFGQSWDDERLSQEALQSYALVPSPALNQVTRHMILQLGGASKKGLIRTARREQGLLHLFHSYCTRARCTECGLSAL